MFDDQMGIILKHYMNQYINHQINRSKILFTMILAISLTILDDLHTNINEPLSIIISIIINDYHPLLTSMKLYEPMMIILVLDSGSRLHNDHY